MRCRRHCRRARRPRRAHGSPLRGRLWRVAGPAPAAPACRGLPCRGGSGDRSGNPAQPRCRRGCRLHLLQQRHQLLHRQQQPLRGNRRHPPGMGVGRPRCPAAAGGPGAALAAVRLLLGGGVAGDPLRSRRLPAAPRPKALPAGTRRRNRAQPADLFPPERLEPAGGAPVEERRRRLSLRNRRTPGAQRSAARAQEPQVAPALPVYRYVWGRRHRLLHHGALPPAHDSGAASSRRPCSALDGGGPQPQALDRCGPGAGHHRPVRLGRQLPRLPDGHGGGRRPSTSTSGTPLPGRAGPGELARA